MLGAQPLSVNPNILINPNAEIDQANEGASVALASGTASYIIDGAKVLYYSAAGAPVITAQRVVDAPIGFLNSLRVTVATGAVVGAGDYLLIMLPIEANEIVNTMFGTINAQSLALTFQIKSAIALYNFSAAIQNFAQTRSYPIPLTVLSSGTWTKFTVVIPGDIIGTWITSGTAGGMWLVITVAAGATYQGNGNAWNAGNYLGTIGNATNTIMTTNGATFQLSAYKLEVAPYPTPIVRMPFQYEFNRCQRLYEKSYSPGVAVATAVGALSNGILWGTVNGNVDNNCNAILYKVTKRIVPTIKIYDGAGSVGYISAANAGASANAQPYSLGVVTMAGFPLNATYYYIGFDYTADARP
jgi:hypothetical protein